MRSENEAGTWPHYRPPTAALAEWPELGLNLSTPPIRFSSDLRGHLLYHVRVEAPIQSPRSLYGQRPADWYLHKISALRNHQNYQFKNTRYVSQ